MPPGYSIDRDALHRYLHRHADHFDRYKMDLRVLSDETGVNYHHLSTVITAMATEGRLRRIAGTSQGRKTYKVEDPSTWTSPPPKKRGPKPHSI